MKKPASVRVRKSPTSPAVPLADGWIGNGELILDIITKDCPSLQDLEDAQNKAVMLLQFLATYYAEEVGGVFGAGALSLGHDVIENLMASVSQIAEWSRKLRLAARSLREAKGAA